MTAAIDHEVDRLLLEGLDDTQIAAKLGISIRRVQKILDRQALGVPRGEPAKTKPASKTSAPAKARMHVIVRWLAPAGPDGQQECEYAVPEALGRIRQISPDEALMRAADGERVLCRRVTPWAPIANPERNQP